MPESQPPSDEQPSAASTPSTPKPPAHALPAAKVKSKRVRAPYTGLLPARAAYPLAALAGILYFVGFAGMDIWPFAFVAFVPLILALHGQAPRDAARLGLLTGLVMNLSGFSWLLGMLQTFSGFPLPLCAVFMLILCSFQGGRFALMGWLHARGTQRNWPRNVVLVLAFVASELCYPLLFPWYFSASMHRVPWMVQSADIGGPILVGVVMLAVNVALAELLLARLEKRPIARAVVAAGFGALLANLGYGALRIHQVDAYAASSEPLKVALIQGNMGLLAKRSDPEEGLRRHMRLSKDMREDGAELLVWSESSVAFASPEDAYNEILQRRFTRKLGVPTIFGAVLYRDNPEPSLARFFNVALASDAEGVVGSRYDKQFLLAFGEYLPFGDRFPDLYKLSPHSGKFSPGSSQAPLSLTLRGKPRKITTLICYEDILPGFTRDAVREAQPELIVNLTNDAWFGDTSEPWEHLALAKMRAVEHHRYLVRSTNSGVSAIIDPVGRTVVETKTFVEDARLAEVHLMSRGTLFEVLGQYPHVLLSVLSLLLAFWRRPPNAASKPPAAKSSRAPAPDAA
jgi:apolipoprotein N-acyltransferase